MSAHAIRKLIEYTPAKLYLASPIVAIVGSGKQRAVVDAVEEVLNLHRESRELELSELDRRVLRNRLIVAAGRLQELIDFDDLNGCDSRNRYAQRNLELFSNIAEELDLKPQQLQALTL